MKPRFILPLLLLVCWSLPAWAGLSDPTAAPDIFTEGRDWFDWARGRVYEFYQACPRERATTYYFDADGGNNANDGLTPATAKQTRAAAISLSATESDVAFLFKRGCIWRESGNWPVGDDETIGDYGTGNKPVFDRFNQLWGESANAWSGQSGNRWQLSYPIDIAWVKVEATPLTRPLMRVASAASCASTNDSWYYDGAGDVLYINLGGQSPNDLDISGCPSNNGENGVEFVGDGSRCENIVAYGWGCHATEEATQDQPFTSRVGGDNTNLFVGCEGYYSGSHSFAHNEPGDSGGRMAAVNCRAGYTKYSATGGETVFNSYSVDGDQETWWVDCHADYGTLPSSDWTPSTNYVRAQGFYAHTGVSQPVIELIVHWGCVIENNPYGCLNLGHCPNGVITSTRNEASLYFVECTFEEHLQPTYVKMIDFPPSSIYYANRLQLYPNTTAPNANETTQRQQVWLANNHWMIDLDACNGANYGLWNPGGAEDWRLFFEHDTIDIFNAGATSGTARWGIDLDVRGVSSASGAGVPGAGTSRNSTMRNCVMSVNKDIGALNVYFLGLTNSTNVKNLAHFGLTDTTGVERGYNLTTSPIALSTAHVWGTPSNQLENAGDTSLRLELDINRTIRTTGTPTVGALETNPDPFPLRRVTLLPEGL